ncbi:hypothetical protein B0H11DRAFT_2295216 [Mycena galericulata]|nr:hypothetical protein B0H11DRAFT_2295216 [Mycena galericulata]
MANYGQLWSNPGFADVAYLCYEYKVLPPGTLLLAPLCIRATPLVLLYARCLPFASRHHRPILGLCLVALGLVPWLRPILLPAVACCPLAAALLACSIRALLSSSHLPSYLLVLLASPLRPTRCPRPTPDTPASCPAVPARLPAAHSPTPFDARCPPPAALLPTAQCPCPARCSHRRLCLVSCPTFYLPCRLLSGCSRSLRQSDTPAALLMIAALPSFCCMTVSFYTSTFIFPLNIGSTYEKWIYRSLPLYIE